MIILNSRSRLLPRILRKYSARISNNCGILVELWLSNPFGIPVQSVNSDWIRGHWFSQWTSIRSSALSSPTVWPLWGNPRMARYFVLLDTSSSSKCSWWAVVWLAGYRQTKVLKTDWKWMSLFKWLEPFKKGHSFLIGLYDAWLDDNTGLEVRNTQIKHYQRPFVLLVWIWSGKQMARISVTIAAHY